MARMKFLCDADRCIECNACVTACKNEHEVPWGINRRRVVTINDGKNGRSRWPACTARMRPARPCALSTVSTPRLTVWCCTPKTSALAVAIASTPVHLVRHNIQKPQTSVPAERWTNARIVQVVLRRITQPKNMRNMVQTVWRKASCRFVLKCVRPSLSWRVTAT
jgi:ferredoxin